MSFSSLTNVRGNFGVRYVAKGHLGMQPEGVGDRTNNPLLSGWPSFTSWATAAVLWIKCLIDQSKLFSQLLTSTHWPSSCQEQLGVHRRRWYLNQQPSEPPLPPTCSTEYHSCISCFRKPTLFGVLCSSSSSSSSLFLCSLLRWRSSLSSRVKLSSSSSWSSSSP